MLAQLKQAKLKYASILKAQRKEAYLNLLEVKVQNRFAVILNQFWRVSSEIF